MRHFLTEPNLWHLNRRSVAGGVFIGLFCAWLPIPGQMLVSVLMCLLFKGNLALAVVCTWVSNPLTYAPMFYLSYQVGLFLFGQHLTDSASFDLNSLFTHLGAIWQPFLLGSLLCGFSVATLGYFSVRIVWRIHVLQIWQRRRRRASIKP